MSYEHASEASGNALYLDANGQIRDLPSFIAPPRDWRPLFLQVIAAGRTPDLAERASGSVAGGRWTARRGTDGWYVEDDAGRVVCETKDGAVATYIAANDPAGPSPSEEQQ